MHGLWATSLGVSFTQNAAHEETAKGRLKKPLFACRQAAGLSLSRELFAHR